MEKIVSQLDPQGFYVGAVVAHPSPLEAGVFHIPGGAVDVSPPDPVAPGKRYSLVEGQWQAQDIPIAPEPEPPTRDQLATAALAQRDALLAFATLRIAPLQDASDLDLATGPEMARLVAWKRYRVDLNRIELQSGFPSSIAWPVAPDV